MSNVAALLGRGPAGQVRWSPWRRWELNTRAGRWATAPLPETARVLVAGGGMAGAVGHAASFRRGTVVALEASSEDAAATERAARTLGLTNLQVELRAPGVVDGLQGVFDLICTTTMLQRMDDVRGALDALAGILAPGGLVVASLNSRRRQYWTDEVRSLLQMLAGRAPGVRSTHNLASSVTHGIDCSETRLFHAVDDARQLFEHDRRAWLDTYVESSAESFELPDVWDLLRGAGLRFLAWRRPDRWHVRPRLLDVGLRDLFERLPDQARWELVDRLLAPEYELIAGHVRDPLPVHAWMDDERALFDSTVKPLDRMRTDLDTSVTETDRAWRSRPEPGVDNRVVIETPARSELVVHRFYEELLANLQTSDRGEPLRSVVERTAPRHGIDAQGSRQKIASIIRRLIDPHGTLVVRPVGAR